MRLVCPNCSAQYEIDGSMIPDEGRDVQCSNCGHTWFELPPPAAEFGEVAPEEFTEDNLDPSDSDIEIPETEAEEPVETSEYEEDEPDEDNAASPAAEAVAAAAAAAVEDEDGEDADDADDSEAGATMVKPRRPADAADLDVLREEAERELSQRRAPPSESIETQTDLGLEEIRNRQSPSRALRARMAHLGEDGGGDAGSEPEAEATRPESADNDEDYTEPQRDLLPDIDEINSTLKPTRHRGKPPQSGRGGFLTGFILMILVAFAMIIAYAQAPAIARAVPNAESGLIGYVDLANAARDWIDGLLGG